MIEDKIRRTESFISETGQEEYAKYIIPWGSVYKYVPKEYVLVSPSDYESMPLETIMEIILKNLGICVWLNSGGTIKVFLVYRHYIRGHNLIPSGIIQELMESTESVKLSYETIMGEECVGFAFKSYMTLEDFNTDELICDDWYIQSIIDSIATSGSSDVYAAEFN